MTLWEWERYIERTDNRLVHKSMVETILKDWRHQINETIERLNNIETMQKELERVRGCFINTNVSNADN